MQVSVKYWLIIGQISLKINLEKKYWQGSIKYQLNIG